MGVQLKCFKSNVCVKQWAEFVLAKLFLSLSWNILRVPPALAGHSWYRKLIHDGKTYCFQSDILLVSLHLRTSTDNQNLKSVMDRWRPSVTNLRSSSDSEQSAAGSGTQGLILDTYSHGIIFCQLYEPCRECTCTLMPSCCFIWYHTVECSSAVSLPVCPCLIKPPWSYIVHMSSCM